MADQVSDRCGQSKEEMWMHNPGCWRLDSCRKCVWMVCRS